MPGGTSHRAPADQVAAVCYRRADGSVQFKLIRTKAGCWLFPKGHVEKGETLWRAAEREALEEAGVRGRIETEPLTVFPHEKRASDGRPKELRVAAYLLHVESESGPPEPDRDPTWFSPEQAKHKLAEKQNPPYQQAYAGVIDKACRKLEQQDADRV